jgi:hypothetical protein
MNNILPSFVEVWLLEAPTADGSTLCQVAAIPEQLTRFVEYANQLPLAAHLIVSHRLVSRGHVLAAAAGLQTPSDGQEQYQRGGPGGVP